MNNNNLNIQFTGHLDSNLVPFLDVVLSHREGPITSSLYRNPLLGNTLLHVDSGHPRHVSCRIPVGQFLRLCRICSEERDFQQEKKEMYGRFCA